MRTRFCRHFCLLPPLLLLLALAAAAQQPKLDIHLDALAAKASEAADITLDGAFLHQGIAFLAQGDGDLSPSDRALLEHLQGIYVHAYSFDSPGQYTAADLASIRAQLRAPGWSRVVDARSRREGESAEVYVLLDGHGAIQGVAILAVDPKSVAVVNIVGPLQLNQIAELGGHLGIPPVTTKPAKPAAKPAPAPAH